MAVEPRRTIDADMRHRMTREAAYYRYVERGCAHGNDLADWFQAESEIDRLLRSSSRPETVLQQRQPESTDVAQTAVQGSSPRSVAHDEAMKRIIRQHPQRDIPRVENLEPGEAPSKE